MTFGLCVAATFVLSLGFASPAHAQRVTETRAGFAASRPDVEEPSVQRPSCSVRLKPFVLSGLAAGFVYGAWRYARAVDDSGDGDFMWPISVTVVIGGATVAGGLAGFVAGTVAQAVSGCAPV